jgi:5-methylcytosine-specific restriction enzyme subunit McrC
MLAYCTSLGLARGHLVYARGNAEPARHRVRGSGVEIVCHALDLDSDPADLPTQVAVLAADVVTPAVAPAPPALVPGA